MYSRPRKLPGWIVPVCENLLLTIGHLLGFLPGSVSLLNRVVCGLLSFVCYLSTVKSFMCQVFLNGRAEENLVVNNKEWHVFRVLLP